MSNLIYSDPLRGHTLAQAIHHQTLPQRLFCVVYYQTIAGSEALLSFFFFRKCFTKRGFARVTYDQTMPGSEAMLVPNTVRMRLTKRGLAHDLCYQAMPGSVALPMLYAIRICLTKGCFSPCLPLTRLSLVKKPCLCLI